MINSKTIGIISGIKVVKASALFGAPQFLYENEA